MDYHGVGWWGGGLIATPTCYIMISGGETEGGVSLWGRVCAGL